MGRADRDLTVKEAAELLLVSSATVRRYAAAGLLPHYRLERGARRFRRSDVARLLAKREEAHA